MITSRRKLVQVLDGRALDWRLRPKAAPPAKVVDWMEKASDQQIPQVTKEIYGTNIRVNCPPRRAQTE
jgi:hypothetical protein